eukprot:TRINITY_DN27510_c0_g1_i1.p1 TRINITY_DN27510_c0_g1~~TRINITY_DN27510_c0_g1_i1.p1  ORF type:complete len:543 (-),score=61.81 TRINITY_DN27510_c0_g1_i1:110-1738(-)
MTTRFAMRALISLSMISCYRSGHPYRPDDCHRREKHIRQQNAYWFLGALRMIRNADTGNREFETDTSGDFFMSEHYEKNGAAVLEDDGRICDGSFCLCPTLPLAETTSLYWSPFCLLARVMTYDRRSWNQRSAWDSWHPSTWKEASYDSSWAHAREVDKEWQTWSSPSDWAENGSWDSWPSRRSHKRGAKTSADRQDDEHKKEKWTMYAEALGLRDEEADKPLCLPLLSTPVVSEEDCLTLDAWRVKCMGTYIDGTPLIDLSAVCVSSLEVFTGWSLESDDSKRSCVLKGAVDHLREQLEVKNRRQFVDCVGRVRSSKLCALAADLWKLPLLELESCIEPRLGLFGASFSEVIVVSANVLTDGLPELKKGLAKLRQTNIDDWDQELGELAASETALSRLVYLSHRRVRDDLHGHALGVAGEFRLEDELKKVSVEYVNESQQREVQQRLFGKLVFPTPDILFIQPGRMDSASSEPIRWIDAKNCIVVPGCTIAMREEKFFEQMKKYSRALSKGAVIWICGWVWSLPPLRDVTYLTLGRLLQFQ